MAKMKKVGKTWCMNLFSDYLMSAGTDGDYYLDRQDNKHFVSDVLFIVLYPKTEKNVRTDIYIAGTDYDKLVYSTDEFLKRDECRAKFYDLLQEKENLEFFNAQRPDKNKIELIKKK